MMDDFEAGGVSRTRFSAMWTAGTFCAALIAPLCGQLIDRFGGRICIPLAMTLTAAASFGLSIVPTAFPYALALAIMAFRCGTRGMLAPYITTVLGQWFQAKRGKVIAVQMTGQQLGISFILGITWETLIAAYGWRTASRIGALAVLLLATPAGLLIFHTPESVGLAPDGAPVERVADAEEADAEAEQLLPSDGGGSSSETKQASNGGSSAGSRRQLSFTRAQALRTLPMYVLMFNQLCQAILGGGLSQNFPALLRENGVAGVSIALFVMIPNGISQSTLPIIAGILRDKGMPPRYILAFAQAMYIAALTAGINARSPAGTEQFQHKPQLFLLHFLLKLDIMCTLVLTNDKFPLEKCRLSLVHEGIIVYGATCGTVCELQHRSQLFLEFS